MKYLILLLLLVGCTATNPNWTKPLPGQPDTNVVPHYIPDPRIHTASNSVIMAADMAAPFNPYAALARPALEAFLLVFGSVSAWKANQKNKALDVMGAAVVKSGAGQQVIAHASNTDHFVAVADAINKATGANQDNTGTPKT